MCVGGTTVRLRALSASATRLGKGGHKGSSARDNGARQWRQNIAGEDIEGLRGRKGDNYATTITICVLPRARGAQGAMQDVNGEAGQHGHERA